MQALTGAVQATVTPSASSLARTSEQPGEAAPRSASVADSVEVSNPSAEGAAAALLSGKPVAVQTAAIPVAEQATTVQAPSRLSSPSAKAGGAIGAAVMSAVGTIGLPIGASVLGAELVHLAVQAAAPALPGAIGIGVGLVAGLAGGIVTEAKFKTGKLLGGLGGGVVGSVIGSIARLVGWQPGPALAKCTEGFSINRLPRRLMHPNYSSYKSLRNDEGAKEALKNVLPGDIIVSHSERYFSGAAWLTKVGGAKADYTHAGIVTSMSTVIDMMEKGTQEVDKNKWLRFSHIAVLRPRYASGDSAWNVQEGARAAMGKTYDNDFKLGGDPNTEYCTEFVYNRIKENAPEIQMGEQKFFGYRFVTPDVMIKSPDVDVVYDSGSDFWLNHLSRFA